MYKTLIFIALLTCTFSSCGSLKEGKRLPKKLSGTEYLSWYASKSYPFRDTVTVDQITYVCALVPREVEVARQLSNQLLSEKEAEEILKEKQGTLQFQLQIMLPQAATDVFHYKLRGDEDLNSRTSYFSFGIKQDLGIKYKNEGALDCLSLHFEKGISNLPVSRIIAYFPYKPEALESISFKPQVFGSPDILFEFKNLIIDKLPQLNL